jgi:hypothetical protein
MSPEDHRRAYLDLASQLENGEDLTEDQKRWLAATFYRLANGEDARKVFSLVRESGQKLADVIARQRMSLILHWVATAIHPEQGGTQRAKTLAEACEEAVVVIVPTAKRMFPGRDDAQYDAEYIQRCWSDPRYEHMRKPNRTWFEPDYPFFQFPDVKDPK